VSSSLTPNAVLCHLASQPLFSYVLPSNFLFACIETCTPVLTHMASLLFALGSLSCSFLGGSGTSITEKTGQGQGADELLPTHL
jgi:hypothetical protein